MKYIPPFRTDVQYPPLSFGVGSHPHTKWRGQGKILSALTPSKQPLLSALAEPRQDAARVTYWCVLPLFVCGIWAPPPRERRWDDLRRTVQKQTAC